MSVPVRVASLNIRGLVTDTKQTSLSVFLRRARRPEITFLQETNLNAPPGSYELSEYSFYINPPTQKNSGTVISLLTGFLEKLTIPPTHTILHPGYAQVLKTHLQETSCHLINVYVSQDNVQAGFILQAVREYVEAVPSEDTVFLGGDWNVTLRPEDRANCVESRNALRLDLSSLIAAHDLQDAWTHLHPDKPGFTYTGVHRHAPRARLDRFYVCSFLKNCITSINVIPAFSDHYAICVNLFHASSRRGAPYWRFNNRLLNNKMYQSYISNIILYYRNLMDMSNNPNSVWDQFKSEVKIVSQRFEASLRYEKQEKVMFLEAQAAYIQSKGILTPDEGVMLKLINAEMSKNYSSVATILKHSNKALVTFTGDTSSKDFINMYKKKSAGTRLDKLRDEGGNIITDESLIRRKVHAHYESHFSSRATKPVPELYQNLPALSHTHREKNEIAISDSELSTALSQLNKGKAPGFDGLTVDFYASFWKDISPMFSRVVSHSFRSGELPKSMQKAVLSLVPKKGDPLLIRNWRPISLLTADYKIIARALTNRLSALLNDIIGEDQTYCVPGRSIHDNLHLIRDAIHFANVENVPLAILSLDQEAAFDSIEHTYIQDTLKAFNFGPVFRAFLGTLYKNARVLVKCNSVLTAPFRFSRGVRQGDPLSGPLFTLCIEPFLHTCRTRMRDYALQLPPPKVRPLVTSTYADDVTLFITHEAGFATFHTTFMAYACASGAKLNVQKSYGLWTGSWRHKIETPLHCEWSSEGGKYLGVYLGNNDRYESKNWYDLEQKIRVGLSRWKRWLHFTSMRGRCSLINSLSGSKLVHVITILEPPDTFVKTITQIYINFVWGGNHWLHPNHLLDKPVYGGQGLYHLPSRLMTLRLAHINLLLSHSKSKHCLWFTNYHLKRYSDKLPTIQSVLTTEKLDPNKMKLLPRFYCSLLRAWSKLEITLSCLPSSMRDIRALTLFDSSIFKHTKFHKLCDNFNWGNINCKLFDDLLNDNNEVKSIEDFDTSLLSAPSLRRLKTILSTISESFLEVFSINNDNQGMMFEYTNRDSQCTTFTLDKSALYSTCLAKSLPAFCLNGSGAFTDETPIWEGVYLSPIDGGDGDVTWRFLHDRLVTPVRRFKWGVQPSPNCPWCITRGTTLHMILECPKTSMIWQIVRIFYRRIHRKESINNILNTSQILSGTPIKKHDHASLLTNFLISLAKSTIYRTYTNKLRTGADIPEYHQVYCKRLKYRLGLEYQKCSEDYYFNNSLWTFNNAICFVKEKKLVFCF
jgi:exonuclease III